MMIYPQRVQLKITLDIVIYYFTLHVVQFDLASKTLYILYARACQRNATKISNQCCPVSVSSRNLNAVSTRLVQEVFAVLPSLLALQKKRCASFTASPLAPSVPRQAYSTALCWTVRVQIIFLRTTTYFAPQIRPSNLRCCLC